MKVKVNLELNLDDTYCNFNNREDIPFSIYNLSNLLSEAICAKVEYKISLLELPEDSMTAARLKVCDEGIKILRSMFDNFEVSGTTEDGHTFHFNDNGYDHSTLVIDGMATKEPGIMYTGKYLNELQAEYAELQYE